MASADVFSAVCMILTLGGEVENGRQARGLRFFERSIRVDLKNVQNFEIKRNSLIKTKMLIHI